MREFKLGWLVCKFLDFVWQNYSHKLKVVTIFLSGGKFSVFSEKKSWCLLLVWVFTPKQLHFSIQKKIVITISVLFWLSTFLWLTIFSELFLYYCLYIQMLTYEQHTKILKFLKLLNYIIQWRHTLTFTFLLVHQTAPTRCARWATWKLLLILLPNERIHHLKKKKEVTAALIKWFILKHKMKSHWGCLSWQTCRRFYRLTINRLTKISLTGMSMYTCFQS